MTYTMHFRSTRRLAYLLVFAALSVTLVNCGRWQRSRDESVQRQPMSAYDDPAAAAMATLTCDQRNSCAGQNARLPFHARNCFCDAACRAYDDCCFDYDGQAETGAGGLSSAASNSTCQRVEEIDTSYEYYIVNKCPREFTSNATVRELCSNERFSDIFHRLPVSGRTSGVLYRNAYCALCAGDTDYFFWRIVHRCSAAAALPVDVATQQPELAIRQLTQCNAELLPPEVPSRNAEGDSIVLSPRKCKSHVNKCERRGRNSGGRRGRCTGPTAYVYDGLQVYRNEECARCNGVQDPSCEDIRTPRVEPEVDSTSNGESDQEDVVTELPVSRPRHPHQPAMTTVSLLVDLNSASGILRQQQVSQQAPPMMSHPEPVSPPTVIPLTGSCQSSGDVYDPYARTCRPVAFHQRLPAPTSAATSRSTTSATTTTPATTTTVTPSTTTSTTASTTTKTMTTTTATTSTTLPTTTVATTVTHKLTTSSTSPKVVRTKPTSAPYRPAHNVDDDDEFGSNLPDDGDGDKDIFWEPPTSRRNSPAGSRGRRPTTTSSWTPIAERRRANDPRTDQQITPTPDVAHTTSGAHLGDHVIDMGEPRSLPCQLLPVDGSYEMLENGSFAVTLPRGSTRSKLPVIFSSKELMQINNTMFVCVVPDNDDGTDAGAVVPDMTEIDDDDDDDGTADSSVGQRIKSRDHGALLITMFPFDSIQSLTSLIGILVSITSLIACLIVVLCLPSLRGNAHGRCLICLILCLLVGQSLYLISTLPGYQSVSSSSSSSTLHTSGNRSRRSSSANDDDAQQTAADRAVGNGSPALDWKVCCYWIAVATHYFLLAAFFWLNVMAMDTARRSFKHRDRSNNSQMPPTKSSAAADDDDRKAANDSCCRECARFVAYSIYAWLVAAVVVAGSIAADWLAVEEPLLRAHYAEAGVCWMAGSHGIPLLVGLPLAALAVANVVLFTLALAVVGCEVGDDDLIAAEGNRLVRRAISGLILTVLLAVCWSSALLAAYLSLAFLWYVFIGLHACVGLVTCLAYAASRETFANLRNRKRYSVGDEDSGNAAFGQSKVGGVNNGHIAPMAGRGSMRNGHPLPQYDEVISQETSI